MADTDELRRVARDLLDDYGWVADRGELDEWADLFTDDASYAVYSRENYDAGLPIAFVLDDSKARILDRVTVIRDFWRNHYDEQALRHVWGGLRVLETNGDSFTVSSSFAVHAVRPDGAPFVIAMGESRDEIVTEPRPRFRSKALILDHAVLPGYFVNPI